VWVEAESSKIGEVYLPAELWQAMKAAGGVELQVTAEERAAYLLRTYRHFVEQPEALKALVMRLTRRAGESVVNEWCERIDARRWEEFVADVLVKHYDPAYRHSRERDFAQVRETLTVDRLDDAGVRRVAEELAEMSRAAAAESERACAQVASGE
jgi:tRNA 2-selenouridine synthase